MLAVFKSSTREYYQEKRLTCIRPGVLHVNALMDKPIMTHALHLVQTSHNLRVIIARHGLHEDTHGPGIAYADMRAADAVQFATGEVVRVPVLLQDHLACVFINLVICVAEAQQRECE